MTLAKQNPSCVRALAVSMMYNTCAVLLPGLLGGVVSNILFFWLKELQSTASNATTYLQIEYAHFGFKQFLLLATCVSINDGLIKRRCGKRMRSMLMLMLYSTGGPVGYWFASERATADQFPIALFGLAGGLAAFSVAATLVILFSHAKPKRASFATPMLYSQFILAVYIVCCISMRMGA